jgi:hypothetical protein
MSAAIAVRFVLWTWFAAAVAAGHFLLLQRLPAFAAPGILLTLTAATLLAYFRIGPLRLWVDGLDLGRLVLLHVTRFVGVYFLYLYQRGELPRAFAVSGGIGDIVVATLALAVVFAPLDAERRLRAIFIWNVVGLIDLALVVLSAARIGFTAPAELRALTHLPLSLLPTFLVPLLFATHIVILVRTLRPKSRGK